jgi:hypothetical protein
MHVQLFRWFAISFLATEKLLPEKTPQLRCGVL